MPLDPERRGELLAATLRALVGGEGVETTFPRGAARVDATTTPHRGWVLAAGDDVARSLGPALVWASRHDVDPERLHLLVDDPGVAADLARRASCFSPAPVVEWIDGRALVPAVPAPPIDLEAPAPPAAMEWVRTLKAAGAEPVVEHGVVVGEVNGLEVARIVDDAEGAYLEVGVGKHDRHAHTLMHGDRPTAAALARAVDYVRTHRRLDAEPHPLNRLARERWLRARVVEQPDLAGAAELRPVSSPVVRHDLRATAPAPAVGVDARGRPVVVVCSTGIDLDLVPAAADARLSVAAPDSRLVLVVPTRDDHPVTRRLAASLTHPAEVRTVDLDAAVNRRD